MKKSLCSILVKFAVLCTLLIYNVHSVHAYSSDELVRDIILINGKAELVEMDQKGEILHRLVAIPDYFRSRRSHQNQKLRSLSKAGFVGSIELKTCPTILASHFLKSVVCQDELIDQSSNSLTLVSIHLSNDMNQIVISESDTQIIQHAHSYTPQKVPAHFQWVSDRKSLVSRIKIKRRSLYLS